MHLADRFRKLVPIVDSTARAINLPEGYRRISVQLLPPLVKYSMALSLQQVEQAGIVHYRE